MRFMARMARELGLIGVLVGMFGYGVAIADEGELTHNCCAKEMECEHVDNATLCGEGVPCGSATYKYCCSGACVTLPPRLD
jgi:hypothetical protein